MAALKDPKTLHVVSVEVVNEKTPFEKLMSSIPDTGLRIAVVGALFMAQDQREEFTRRYGIIGITNLDRLMQQGEKR